MMQTNAMTTPPLNRVTLRFRSARLEKEFTAWIYASRNVRMRLAMLLVSILYVILGVLDPHFSTGALGTTAQYFHLFVIVPMLLLTIVIGSLKGSEHIFVPASVVTTATAAACHLFLVQHQGLQSIYVPELYFMILWIFTVAGFRLWTAIILSLGIILAAVLNASIILSTTTSELYGYFFWLFVSFSLAYLGGHMLEYYAKVNFYTVIRLQREINERKIAQERLKRAAFHDALTGLPNRILLSDRLKEAIMEAKQKKEKVGWLYIDLDHFKQLNDTQGHGAGDKLLAIVGHRLKNCVRETDTVGRLGGDEFTVLLTGIKDAEDAMRIAEKIRADLEAPYDLGSRPLFRSSASIGVALYPDHGADETALSKSADAAMYRSKNKGRNAVTICSAS